MNTVKKKKTKKNAECVCLKSRGTAEDSILVRDASGYEKPLEAAVVCDFLKLSTLQTLSRRGGINAVEAVNKTGIC